MIHGLLDFSNQVRDVAVVYHFIAWKCLFIGCKDALDLPAWYLVNRRIFLTIIFLRFTFYIMTRLSHTTQILCCHYLNIVYKACLIFTFHS